MSRPLVGWLIVAGIAARSLDAQDVAQLGRRVDSTFRAATAAQQTLADYRKTHPPRFDFSDSAVIATGKVRIYFNTDLADAGHAGAAEAEKQLSDLGRALDRLPPFTFSIVGDTALNRYDEQFGRTRGINVRQHFASGKPNRTSTESDPQSIATAIVVAVSQVAGGSAPSGIANWTSGGVLLAPGLSPKPDWGAIRLAIVSSPSPLGRSCYLGELRACRLFLALDKTSDPVHVLFDVAGRRRMVNHERDKATMATSAGTERCLSGNDDACVAVLNIIGLSPLSSSFERGSLLTHALAVGGPRAAERLLTATGSIGDALAAAANQPLDSLVADWQQHLSERSGSAGNVPLTIAISSLVWVAACVFLSLRGSRWR